MIKSVSDEGEILWNLLFPHRVQVSFEAFVITFETYFKGKYSSTTDSASASDSTSASASARGSASASGSSGSGSGSGSSGSSNTSGSVSVSVSGYVPADMSIRSLLLHSIVQESSGVITKKSFLNFIQLFGPVRLCLVKIASNLFQMPVQQGSPRELYAWYHGSITRKEAEQLLLTKSPTVGDFLVRLSESQGGKFTIVYVSSNRTLKNVLIHNYFESGYGLEYTKEQCPEGHNFENLPDFINLHSHKLKTGIKSGLHIQDAKELHFSTSTASNFDFNRTYRSNDSSSSSSGSLTSHDTDGLSATTTMTAVPESVNKNASPCQTSPSDECPYGSFPMPVPKSISSISSISQTVAPVLPTSMMMSSDFFNDAEGDDNYGCFMAPPKTLTLSSSQSISASSSSTSLLMSPSIDCTGPPELSRRQLSSNLDNSKHLLKENKVNQALDMTVSVIDIIVQKTSCSCDNCENVDSDDLVLIAKAFLQKGNIEEAMKMEASECLLSFFESLAYWTEVYRRAEFSDRFQFEYFSLFSNLHRKMADIFARRGNIEKAEFHYAECSGLMLQDPDLDVELRNRELVNHIGQCLPMSTATETSATTLLESGIEAYKKGSRYYSVASEFLQKALVCSRLCGAEAIELRAVANLATVEAALELNILAIRHYHQCCILCRQIKKDNDTTLKQILFKKSLLLMKVGYYNRTIECINESIGIATSMSNIEKLEALKQKALDKLAQH